uniref:ISXO2-like transposase domain-containing protein n=1 Tax=Anopheles arabiensis TaxID=7173 RepID=A0A182I8G5_ANOAR
MTDCWRSYDTLEDYGYVHKKPFLRSKGTNKKNLISYIREYEFKRCSTNVFESILLALKAE